jgi:hypothetical protein
MLIRGKCHCGNISFSLTWDPDPKEIPARACDCTFCQSRHAFGTESAQFLICARCGIVPVVTSRIDDRLYAVVSVNAFENVDPALLKRAPISFEAEQEETRLARRKRNWIANVAIK